MATELRTKALQEFQEATQVLVNPALQQWKDQGRGVIGCYCSYIPIEVITAAGFTPFRMRGTGSTGTDLADTCVSSINCSFVRHSLDLALRGEYSFLDGVIWVNSCDHVRRIYDHWKRKVETSYLRLLALPKKNEPDQIDWYRDEIRLFRESLGPHFGLWVSDDSLRDAIKLHNETRRLQRKIYELRKGKNPPITGAEMLSVMVAGTAMPVEYYNNLLKELVDELEKSKEGHADHRARIMLIGGILDDPAYVEVIESQGGLVVTDSLCFGTRIMWGEVDETTDPITALAQYYLYDRPQCARIFGDQPKRSAFVKDMVRDFNVDGVITERLVMCDNWTGEQFMMGEDLKEAGIPYMRLDRDYLNIGSGQLRTRVQAFLEMMGR